MIKQNKIFKQTTSDGKIKMYCDQKTMMEILGISKYKINQLADEGKIEYIKTSEKTKRFFLFFEGESRWHFEK